MKALKLTAIAVLLAGILIFLAYSRIDNGTEDTGLLENQSQDQGESGVTMDENAKFLEFEVLVKFKEDIGSEDINSFIGEHSLQVLNIIERIGVYHFKFAENISVESMVERLSKDSRVEYAEPNYIIKFEL
ncbi:MAG: hypothetical protein PHQ54_03140 [Candidatus Omnitrophica bacterium]|nr:hypothetical protein [Candidatus Omnitrophota bacterium]